MKIIVYLCIFLITYGNGRDVKFNLPDGVGLLPLQQFENSGFIFMEKVKDLTGKRFERLVVISRVENNIHGKSVWKCKCDCGKIVNVVAGDLKSGNTLSCGCFRKENPCRIKHGLAFKHSLYYTWLDIKKRCYNERIKQWNDYGGRGISVCEEWRNDFKKFYDWAISNGWEKGLSLDRIDNNGNYAPTNCRWVTMNIQQNNKRNNFYITCYGETKTLSEWCKHLNLNYSATKNRITYLNWSIKKSFETPPMKNQYKFK